ncbi:MAG: hypothetical protein GY835_03720 [bacterium]|nr:hypothetical protein [bacterium]
MTNSRDPAKIVREIKRKTRCKFSAEEKIGIVLKGLHDKLALRSALYWRELPRYSEIRLEVQSSLAT